MFRFLFYLLLLSVSAWSKSLTITFAGDTTLGGDFRNGTAQAFNKRWQESNQDPESFLDPKIRAMFKEDSLTIVNLEGVIGTKRNPIEAIDKRFSFWGKAEYLGILAANGIDMVNIANNHILDYGRLGYIETMLCVFGWSPKIFFNGLVNKDSDESDDDKYKDSTFIGEFPNGKVHFLGFNLYKSNVTQKFMLKALKRATPSNLRVVFLHWGIENHYTPEPWQREMAHRLIDGGADVIVGCHPHVVQPVEYYKGKPIVYSLGNFIYGGHTNPKDKRAIIYQYTLNDDGTHTDKVVPIWISSCQDKNDYRVTLRGE